MRFARVVDELAATRRARGRPAIDVMGPDEALVARADLPELTPDELKLEFEDGIPTVSGEHPEERTDPDGGCYVRRERRFDAFSRSIGVDAQAIKAKTRDGVVEVTVPVARCCLDAEGRD